MNILVVNSKYPPEYAGSALRSHNTAIRLKEKYNVKFRVLSSSIEYNKSSVYNIDGISINRVANKINIQNIKWIKYLEKIPWIYRFFIRFLNLRNMLFEAIPTIIFLIIHYKWYDIIHVYGNVIVTSTAISFAKITKKPLLIELVNLVEEPKFFEPKTVSLLFGTGFYEKTKIIAISKALERACINSGINKKKVWCRPNPINESLFYFKEVNHENSKINQQLNTKDVWLLHLAKLMPLKNQIFMLEVLKFLPNNYKINFSGILVKSGPYYNRDNEYYSKFIQKVQEYDLLDRVEINLGFIKNPAKIMRKSDVFVFPSIREAFGTPILESIACGLPVVTNDLPGVFDQWVEEGKNGYTCKLDDKLWARRIIDATQISNNLLRMSSEKILNLASTKVIDEKYYQLFNEIIT
jgi:glycosyltransferase involved in cell wall biosynthesis